MRRRTALGICMPGLLIALWLAPAALAAGPKDGTVTVLKGSAIRVTFPDGTVHAQPMRGNLLGTFPAPGTGRVMTLYQSNAQELFGPGARLCDGVTIVWPIRQGFILAQVYSGAPPSTMTLAGDGKVVVSMTVNGGMYALTGCAAPFAVGQTPDPTLTLTGRTGGRGLRHLVLRGGRTGIPVSGGKQASFRLTLITRVDVS
jgi:hypothetical protein